MEKTVGNLKLSRCSSVVDSEDEDLPEMSSYFENMDRKRPTNLDRNETKRVKNCHRERCRVQKLNSSLHHLNMLLPQTQRSPGNGKHFSKAIILETCSDFIYQLENHVFDMFFDTSVSKDSEDKMPRLPSYLSSLLNSRRSRHSNQEQKESLRIKRPKNSFILFSMGQRKQLLKENPCLDNNKVSKILGEKWKNLDEKSKSNFNELAKVEKSNHKMKFPQFNYTIKRKRPRPITKKAVDTAVCDYLERDGSFSKLKSLIHRFPPTFSLKDILLSSCSEGIGETRRGSFMDLVKMENESSSDFQQEYMHDPYLYPNAPIPTYPHFPSLHDMFPSHPYEWGSDENLFLQQVQTAPKCEYTGDYPEYGYTGFQGLEDNMVTPKEEFEKEDEATSCDFITPSLFYYPLTPAQIFSQIEPLSSGYQHLPLFTLPPISQLISNEN